MRSSRTRRGTVGRRHSLLVEAPETAEPAGSVQMSSSGNACLLVCRPLAAPPLSRQPRWHRQSLTAKPAGRILRLVVHRSARRALAGRLDAVHPCAMRDHGKVLLNEIIRPPESRSPSRPFRTSRCCYSCMGETAPKRNTASCSRARVFACTMSGQPVQIRPNITL